VFDRFDVAASVVALLRALLVARPDVLAVLRLGVVAAGALRGFGASTETGGSVVCAKAPSSEATPTTINDTAASLI
jgi:hypothetical protein